jgi:hypothetical protein
MLTGKGWCSRKNGEHHRCIIYIVYERIWILEKRKKGISANMFQPFNIIGIFLN